MKDRGAAFGEIAENRLAAAMADVFSRLTAFLEKWADSVGPPGEGSLLTRAVTQPMHNGQSDVYRILSHTLSVHLTAPDDFSPITAVSLQAERGGARGLHVARRGRTARHRAACHELP
ncbi:hypothetical protein CMUS01_10293 [Colletotrichum musicola]|uniref:Uncharacterized protein n=1 Tax=Colletotrichum musicola TaxID=2175873 RepID=A0A8H6K402_9PEZI|nr:hypothetical protein CMUS01_10293 [Colletotrichum musicola]